MEPQNLLISLCIPHVLQLAAVSLLLIWASGRWGGQWVRTHRQMAVPPSSQPSIHSSPINQPSLCLSLTKAPTPPSSRIDDAVAPCPLPKVTNECCLLDSECSSLVHQSDIMKAAHWLRGFNDFPMRQRNFTKKANYIHSLNLKTCEQQKYVWGITSDSQRSWYNFLLNGKSLSLKMVGVMPLFFRQREHFISIHKNNNQVNTVDLCFILKVQNHHWQLRPHNCQ